MTTELLLTAVAMLAAGTPIGWFARRLLAQQPPPSPPGDLRALHTQARGPHLADELEAAAAPQHHHHRHHVTLNPRSIRELATAVGAVLAEQQARALAPIGPAQPLRTAPEPEERIAREMQAAIENGANALVTAARERGVTLTPAQARQQAATMLFAAYDSDDSRGR